MSVVSVSQLCIWIVTDSYVICLSILETSSMLMQSCYRLWSNSWFCTCFAHLFDKTSFKMIVVNTNIWYVSHDCCLNLQANLTMLPSLTKNTFSRDVGGLTIRLPLDTCFLLKNLQVVSLYRKVTVSQALHPHVVFRSYVSCIL